MNNSRILIVDDDKDLARLVSLNLSEAGFDTFAAMGKTSAGARAFLAIIEERESKLIDLLFDSELAHCRTALARI